MTALINTDNVGNTYLNYANPVTAGELVTNDNIRDLLIAHFGDDQTRWRWSNMLTTNNYFLRFPVPFETLTGDIPTLNSAVYGPVGSRFTVYTNAVTGTTNTAIGGTRYNAAFNASNTSSLIPAYQFIVLNNYSMTIANFTDIARTSLQFFSSFGWCKDPAFVGGQYPRNAYSLSQGVFRRATKENVSGVTELSRLANTITNPVIDCTTPTAGANTTDVLLRDDAAPNNYIGKAWNLIQSDIDLPNGTIVKNLGVDPDGSNNNKWMRVGTLGSRPLYMRVYTENLN